MRSDTDCNADTRAFARAGSTFISELMVEMVPKGAADLVLDLGVVWFGFS
jgi:hypothetical protein